MVFILLWDFWRLVGYLTFTLPGTVPFYMVFPWKLLFFVGLTPVLHDVTRWSWPGFFCQLFEITHCTIWGYVLRFLFLHLGFPFSHFKDWFEPDLRIGKQFFIFSQNPMFNFQVKFTPWTEDQEKAYGWSLGERLNLLWVCIVLNTTVSRSSSEESLSELCHISVLPRHTYFTYSH